jgi:hypothetical protein
MKIQSLIIGSVLLLGACGSPPAQNDYEDESKNSTFASGTGAGSRNSSPSLVAIPISVDYGAFGLTGTAATAYSVTLDNNPAGDPGGASTCLSAYTATVSQANLDGIEVYKDDRNCLAKLTSFTFSGTVYNSTNAGAVNFTTWLANDTAIFASAGGVLIRVKVVSQLATPISGTEAIVYNFSELLDATTDYTFSEAAVSDPHAITVTSQEAPHFSVVAATFTGLDNTTAAAELSFKMECVDNPVAVAPTSIAMNAGSAANSLCGSNDLNAITYKLVIDSYGSVLTLANAEAIFGTAGTSVTMPGDQYADSATNEGFNTAILDGPGAIGTAANQHMILILKAGISYTYYNVDITAITQ